MKKQVASSPTRIDLAGGTLDIWPLNMLVDRALTVNVAIDLLATATLTELDTRHAPADAPASRVEVTSQDQQVTETWASPSLAPTHTKLPLIAECVKFLEPEYGFTLTTNCASPAGAGLGGSSALAVSVLGGLQAYLGRSIMPPEEMLPIVRDIEARVLKIPTGTQDHFAATFGGAAAIHYGPGRPVREALPVNLDRLASRLVLAYAGASRLSASANWDMMRRAIDGETATVRGLGAIASIAHEMRAALIEGDLDAAGALMDREWRERKGLSPKVSTPAIEKALSAARTAGAVAGKVCGAGGGGCIAFLCRDGARDAVGRSLSALGGDGVRVLEARPTPVGLQLVG